MENLHEDNLVIYSRKFQSRLILGITSFDPGIMNHLVNETKCEMVTHTLHYDSDLCNANDTHLDVLPEDLLYVPNTHGCKSADEAVSLARKIRKAGVSEWIKLEVSPSNTHYMSDALETLKAAEILVRERFVVLPYIHADPILAKRLEEIGCATVMPLGAPIGTGQGLKAREFIGMIVEEASVPVIVDAGIGRPSHAVEAMEMGVDAVIVHTAILYSQDQLRQARAFRLAVAAGRESFLAGSDRRRAELSSQAP